MIESLDTPVDLRRFSLTVYTVNAAASRNTNTIIFPAGILQVPFYDKNASFEENLGSIGQQLLMKGCICLMMEEHSMIQMVM